MMLLYAILSITILYFIFLIVKEFVHDKNKENFCALCGAVSITWFALLFLYAIDLFNDQVVIALLMGCSVVGLFYFISKRVSDKTKLFRLPFFTTLLSIAYFVINWSFDFAAVIVNLILWLIFMLIALYNNNNKLIQKIISCCKDW